MAENPPFLENWGAKLNLWAPTIYSFKKLQLSDGKLQFLPIPTTSVTQDAAVVDWALA